VARAEEGNHPAFINAVADESMSAWALLT